MSRLIIIGAGGHGKVIADTAQTMNRFHTIVFLDDFKQGSRICDLSVVGGFDVLEAVFEPGDSAAIAFGNNQKRMRYMDIARKIGYGLPILIHPRAVVSKHAQVDEGSVVFANAVIHADSWVQQGAIINTGAIIEHDNQIGRIAHISPGACLAGNTKIGQCSWIGIGSCIIQNITVGESCILAAGSTLLKNMPDYTMFAGSPAEYKKRLERNRP